MTRFENRRSPRGWAAKHVRAYRASWNVADAVGVRTGAIGVGALMILAGGWFVGVPLVLYGLSPFGWMPDAEGNHPPGCLCDACHDAEVERRTLEDTDDDEDDPFAFDTAVR